MDKEAIILALKEMMDSTTDNWNIIRGEVTAEQIQYRGHILKQVKATCQTFDIPRPENWYRVRNAHSDHTDEIIGGF